MSASRVCGLLVPATLLSDSATEEDEDEAEILPFGGGVCEYRAIRPRTEDRLAILLMLLVRLALGLGKVKEEVVTNGDDKDGVGFNWTGAVGGEEGCDGMGEEEELGELISESFSCEFVDDSKV